MTPDDDLARAVDQAFARLVWVDADWLADVIERLAQTPAGLEILEQNKAAIYEVLGRELP